MPMDPVTTIGLASAVITLVDVGTKISKRIKQLSDAGDLPDVFRDIRTRLPLIISIVSAHQGKGDLLPEAEEAFEKIVRQCFDQVSQLDASLEKVTITKADSRFKRIVKASVSLVEEGRVQRIAAALADNIQLLTFLNVTPAEKGKLEERPRAQTWISQPLPSYVNATGAFLVPFSRDEQFVGRESALQSITTSLQTQNRVAISGMGGIG